jgi:hypothetical protein
VSRLRRQALTGPTRRWLVTGMTKAQAEAWRMDYRDMPAVPEIR